MARGADLERKVLAAVGRTIYREGIHATGVDRLCEVAGVSKRTLYLHFTSKDELVRRALEASDPSVAEALLAPGNAAREARRSGCEQILAVFRELRRKGDDPAFRGCPFVNAAIELADTEHPAHSAIQAHKDRVRAWFERAARADGLRQPATVARRLMLVLDGFFVTALVQPGASAAVDAHALASSLLRDASADTG